MTANFSNNTSRPVFNFLANVFTPFSFFLHPCPPNFIEPFFLLEIIHQPCFFLY
jgi:hypothetical protein